MIKNKAILNPKQAGQNDEASFDVIDVSKLRYNRYNCLRKISVHG